MQSIARKKEYMPIEVVTKPDYSMVEPTDPPQYGLTQRACGDIVLVRLMYVQGYKAGVPFGGTEWHEVPFVSPLDVKFLAD